LGVKPIAIEVNPYLADLIEAKLTSYRAVDLSKQFGKWVHIATKEPVDPREFFSDLPKTFVEPGVKGRWIFNYDVAARLAAYVKALNEIECPKSRRLFRALLGGVLIDLSNVVISGKGRRYRGSWQSRVVNESMVDQCIFAAIESAVTYITRYADRAESGYELFRGSCVKQLKRDFEAEISVFSPPYPNSFDYTDVYNVELWLLGYLKDSASNQDLRRETLCSHVQVDRAFQAAPSGSQILADTVRDLEARRANLWDRRIPEMVGGYFADLSAVTVAIASKLPVNGQIWMVVGDSRYDGIDVPVAAIMADLAESFGCEVVEIEPCRSMRASPQQGGDSSLAETLLVLGRR
jgi:hypothetical protein